MVTCSMMNYLVRQIDEMIWCLSRQIEKIAKEGKLI